MRILFAAYDSVSIDQGGPLVQIHETKRWLEDAGIDVRLFDRWGPWNPKEFDLVHLFVARFYTYQFARTLHLNGIPYVVSPIFYANHGPYFIRTMLAAERAVSILRHGLWTGYGFTKQVCEWAVRVLPNTDAEARLIMDGMGIRKEKMRTIPNGVNPDFEHADPSLFERKYGLRNFVLCVGHIGPVRKNILRLIQAVDGIDRPVVIIGRMTDGGETSRCIEEAARNPMVHLIPGLEHNSPLLASAYAACDVFVLPSQFETPGIAALEAGLAGAKVAITKVGGTKEYFAEFAEYLDPRSTVSIRNAIDRTLQKNRTTDLQHHIKEEFSWRAVAEKTLAVYNEVLSCP